MNFLTLTNTKLFHLIGEKTLHEGQMWATPFWSAEGGDPISPDQKFRVGEKTISIAVVFINKYGHDLAYWMVDETNNTPFFKTWTEIKKAIEEYKLIKI